MIWFASALAATIMVPKDADLQEAVDTAVDGDTILVATDFVPSSAWVEYFEKDLTIEGDGGIANLPPIHAFDAGLTLRSVRISDSDFNVWPVLVLANGDARSALLEDVHLEQNHERAAFEAQNAGSLEVEIRDSTFTANSGDGAIQLAYSSLVVEGCTFTGNDNWSGGGAIWTRQASSVEISWSTFEDNISAKEGGALSFIEGGGAPVSITSSDFNDNVAETWGGDLYVDGHDLQLQYVTALDGKADSGGFLYTNDVPALKLDDVIVHRPTATTSGGLMYVNDCTDIEVTRSQLCGATNASDEWYDAALLHIAHNDVAEISLQNVVVQGTSGGSKSPAVVVANANLELVNTTFVENPTIYGIFLGTNLAGTTLENNIFDGARYVVNYSTVSGSTEGSHNLFNDISSYYMEPRETFDPAYVYETNAQRDVDPEFAELFDPTNCDTLPYLGDTSPAIDAGTGTDWDGSTADLGAFGGHDAGDLFVFPDRPGDTGDTDEPLDTDEPVDTDEPTDSVTDSEAPDTSTPETDEGVTTTWMTGGCSSPAGAAGLLLISLGGFAAASRRRFG